MQVMGIGSVLMDILVHVDDAFISSVPAQKGGGLIVDYDEVERILKKCQETPHYATGGVAMNTIFGLAKLGMESSFLGKVGKDELGREICGRLKETSISTKNLKYSSNMPTGRCLCMITPDSQRTMRSYMGAAGTFAPEEISDKDFNGISHVHIEFYQFFNPSLGIKIVKSAQKAGCTISMDLCSFEWVAKDPEFVKEILSKYVDYVFANEDEAWAFSGSRDPDRSLEALGEVCTVAAIKLGERGSKIKVGDQRIDIPALPAKAIDTTGAGDLWAAGFLYGYFQGMPLEDCGYLASFLGAKVVEQYGAHISDAVWQEVKTLLAKFKPAMAAQTSKKDNHS